MQAADIKTGAQTDKYGFVRIGTDNVVLEYAYECNWKFPKRRCLGSIPAYSVLLRTPPYSSVQRRLFADRSPAYAAAYPKRPFAGTPKQPMMVVLFTPASCERVARERAGGERGLIFAKQKASRVHPSIAAASSAVAATMR